MGDGSPEPGPRVGYIRLRRPEDDVGNDDTGADSGARPFWGVPRAVVKVAIDGVERDGEIDPGRLLSIRGQASEQRGPLVIHEGGGERLLLEASDKGMGPVVNIVHQVSDRVAVTMGLGNLPLGRPVEYTVGGTRVRLTRVVFDPRLPGGW